MKQIIPESFAKVVYPNGRKGGIRGYSRKADRQRAITLMSKRGFNHFTCYKDNNTEFVLQYGYAEWAGSRTYINR